MHVNAGGRRMGQLITASLVFGCTHCGWFFVFLRFIAAWCQNCFVAVVVFFFIPLHRRRLMSAIKIHLWWWGLRNVDDGVRGCWLCGGASERHYRNIEMLRHCFLSWLVHRRIDYSVALIESDSHARAHESNKLRHEPRSHNCVFANASRRYK